MPSAFTRRSIAAGHIVAVVAAIGLAVVAFVYRFNTLGGSLGGFDNDDFFVITRADMILDGQRPLRDFVDAELRGAWPSLSYAVPAWTQMLWGRSLLVIASLSVGALALCTGVVFLLARDLSRSWLVGFLAGATVAISGTKLYNHPKVLALTIGAAAIRWTVARPTLVRLTMLAAWTVIAGLYRHDYAVYIGVAAVAALIASEPRPWRVPARRVLIYVGLGVLFALPSMVWVARNWGIGRYLNQALLAPVTEGLRLEQWPAVMVSMPFETDSLAAFNYYAFWAMPLAGLVILATSSWADQDRDPALRRAIGTALVAMTLLVNYFFLRSNLPGRLGDAVVPNVLLAAWVAHAAGMTRSRVARVAGVAAVPVVLTLIVGAFLGINSVVHQLATARITESPTATWLQFDYIRRTLRALPPDEWSGQDLNGPFAAARYLAECTNPDDHVLVGAYAYEIPYFARRRFAGGQGLFSHGFFVAESYQRRVLERLAHQSVPIVLTDEEFAKNYPLVARYVTDHYRDVGIIRSRGEPYVRVFVETTRPHGTDRLLGLPCFR